MIRTKNRALDKCYAREEENKDTAGKRTGPPARDGIAAGEKGFEMKGGR